MKPKTDSGRDFSNEYIVQVLLELKSDVGKLKGQMWVLPVVLPIIVTFLVLLFFGRAL